MGDRANIQLSYGGETPSIFFYTHWAGSEIHRTLADALERGKGRWDDPPYLARIIFCEMIKDDVMSDTGFGIHHVECDSGPLPVVNMHERTVMWQGQCFSFEKFVAAFAHDGG